MSTKHSSYINILLLNREYGPLISSKIQEKTEGKGFGYIQFLRDEDA